MRSRPLTVGLVAAAVGVAGCGTAAPTTSTSTVPRAATPTATTTTAPRAATTSAQATTTAPHAGACAPSRLAVAYAGTEGATGHMELTLTVRNRAGAACTLSGYPGARLLDASGRPLPLRVTRGDGFFPDTLAAPHPVRLAAGATARLGISFVTNNEYAGARVCRTAAAAAIALPGSAAGAWTRVSLRRAPRIRPCGDRLVVSPVHV